MKKSLLAAMACVSAVLVAAPAFANYTCSTVTRRGLMDPDTATLNNRFREPLAVNAAGDSVFISRPIANREKVYHYPAGGGDEVVAAVLGPAPNGGTYRLGKPFEHLSINDGGDIGYCAGTTLGGGVFVKMAGQPAETGATVTTPSPAGGTFADFSTNSAINNMGVIAFIAEVSGGPSGVFSYNGNTDSLAAVALEGDATLDGREMCSYADLELNNVGNLVVVANSKVDCADAGEPSVQGLFWVTPLGTRTILLRGDASPIPGTDHGEIIGRPDISSANFVAFRTKTTGTFSGRAVFRWDPFTMSTTHLGSIGDATPVGLTLRKIRDIRIADNNDVFLLGLMRHGTDRFAILKLNDLGYDVAVTKSDPVPTDEFTASARHLRFGKRFDVSDDGSSVVVKSRVRDILAPRQKVAVFSCASPSGAFIDEEVLF